MTELHADIVAHLLSASEKLDATTGGRSLTPAAAGRAAADIAEGLAAPATAADTVDRILWLIDLDNPDDLASPLGLAIVEVLGADDKGPTVTQAHAAELLGISPQRVSQLVQGHKLTTDASGRVKLASVACRLAGQRRLRVAEVER